MRILLSSLLLLGGVNLILARSIYWNDDGIISNNWLSNYEDDLFEIPKNNDDNDDFLKSLFGENFNESPEELRSLDGILNNLDLFEISTNNDHDDFLKTLLGENSNESPDDLDKSEEKSIKSVEVEENAHDDHEFNAFDMFFNNNPFVHIAIGDVVPKSSEENTNDDEDEEEEEVEETTDEQVESVDLTKSSEEKKTDEEFDISEKEIEELAALMITLSAIDGLIDISNKMPEYSGDNGDDELKSKEVDEFLQLFSSILDNILEDQVDHESKEDKEDDNDNDDDEDEDCDDVTTPTNNSDEEKDDDDNDPTYVPDSDEENNDDDDDDTTPEPDSDDENNDDDEDNTTPEPDSDEEINVTTPGPNSDENDTDDTSNSNENEVESYSLTFHGIDDDHQQNLNNHKYEIVNPSAKPIDTLNFDANNVIQEYVELRQDLDTEQDALKVNEQHLDKDFYSIISNNYSEDSLSRFEKDSYVVHENLDRIKRNINAIQNLNSKLYLHKLVYQAVNNVRK